MDGWLQSSEPLGGGVEQRFPLQSIFIGMFIAVHRSSPLLPVVVCMCVEFSSPSKTPSLILGLCLRSALSLSMCACIPGSQDDGCPEEPLRVEATFHVTVENSSETIPDHRERASKKKKQPENYVAATLDLIMSATDLMIKRPDLLISYTDSTRLYGGYDCTDHNEKASLTSSGHHAKESMSAPQEQAEVQPTTTTSPTIAAHRELLNGLDLNREDVRLRTFDNENWDVPFLNKSKLAQIGFYYIGPQDTVKCKFCQVEIGKWEQEDDCFTEHSRWSPNCPLLRRQHTENVPIDAEELNQILPPITYDTCGLTSGGVLIRPNAYAERSFTPSAEMERSSTASSGSPPRSPEELGSPPQYMFGAAPTTSAQSPIVPAMDSSVGTQHMLAPMSAQMYSSSSSSYINPVTTPHLEIEANRLKTFKEWPINLKMKPIELSDAGFFYTGMGDRVQCFSCGGGLKNWEDDDVAWEQHALWYPNCEYLKLIRGQKYIDAVKAIHARKQMQEERENAESSEAEEESTGGASVESASSSSFTATEDDENGNISRSRRVRGLVQRDPLPSTSNASGPEVRKMARRRHGSGSHPEADLQSAEAILAAKSAKPSDLPEAKLCKICFEAEFNTAFIPCGHVVACAKCASAVTTCPVCREPFDSVTRIYFS